MKIIDDKDVGELWRAVQGLHWLSSINTRRLICKLVEERAKWRAAQEALDDGTVCEIRPRHHSEALRDFGIDPATYPGAK